MSKKFRWCFIGAGDLGQNVAGSIIESQKHEIVSVYTRRYEAGQTFAEKFGSKAYQTPEEAIAADGVDGVYICTPHNSHYEYARMALNLGKSVLCEKAFTVTATEARELFALAKEKGLYIAEAMWTWFSPVTRQIKSWLDDGLFGEIEDFYIMY